MKKQDKNIQIISAPSILGITPSGVEHLADNLLAVGLAKILGIPEAVTLVPTLNSQYSRKRDPLTNCLNPKPIHDYSIILGKTISETVKKNRFAFTLGGDCSILIGIMSGLRSCGAYGLIFIDAHADFYQPDRSTTGQVADMDLAIVTGRGPEMLTNINHLRPYVKDEHVIHIGQRDWKETQYYGSQDIKETSITCFDLGVINTTGIDEVMTRVLQHIKNIAVDGFWIHFDTDALSDEVNPAVDYRLPGGLAFKQTETIIGTLLSTNRIAGISVTIFNPSLDPDGHISGDITESLGRAFS